MNKEYLFCFKKGISSGEFIRSLKQAFIYSCLSKWRNRSEDVLEVDLFGHLNHCADFFYVKANQTYSYL